MNGHTVCLRHASRRSHANIIINNGRLIIEETSGAEMNMPKQPLKCTPYALRRLRRAVFTTLDELEYDCYAELFYEATVFTPDYMVI